MQMFIAVINENFSVAEEAKREMQASNYSEQRGQTIRSRWINMLNPYLWLRTRSTTVNAESSSSTLVLGEAETLVQHDPLPMHEGLSQVVSIIFDSALLLILFHRDALRRVLVASLIIYDKTHLVCSTTSSPEVRQQMIFHFLTYTGYVLNQEGQTQSSTTPIDSCEDLFINLATFLCSLPPGLATYWQG
jgi:hypothetical protein